MKFATEIKEIPMSQEVNNQSPRGMSGLHAAMMNGGEYTRENNFAQQSDDGAKISKTEELLQKLDQCRLLSLEMPPERPPLILSALGKRLGEAGNLVVLQGQAKAGKSAGVSAILGAALGGRGDCFGFESPNPEEKAVLHFDTEQSRCAHFDLVKRVVKDRAGLAEIPPHFHTFSLLQIDLRSRFLAIEQEMARASVIHNGIHMVVIDGVADITPDPNNPEECFPLVDNLHALADKFLCLIVLVLHENPNAENGKTRGHLGSQLERKVETPIVIEKGADEIVAMYARPSRDCYWPKSEAVYFKYDEAEGMHISVPDPTSSRIAKRNSEKKVNLQSLAEKVISGGMRNCDLKEAIMGEEHVADRTAANRISAMLKMDVIKKTNDGLYYLFGEEG